MKVKGLECDCGREKHTYLSCGVPIRVGRSQSPARIQDDPEAMAALSLLQEKGYNGDEVREALLKLEDTD